MATDVDVTPLLCQQLNGRSEASEVESPPTSPELCTQPVPRALAGVIVYVEVRSIDSRQNRSSAIASELETLGATVCTRFTKDVTHVVFKDGKSSVKERAERNGVYLVSPLWVEACKRANDWISEAKYPVITRDSSGGAGTAVTGTPVVLGKIKRIKSMQPKPLEEEIARSLERCRNRPQAVIPEEREGGNVRRDGQLDMETDEDSCTSSIDLPHISLPSTPRHPLSEKPSNTVTPFLNVQKSNKPTKTPVSTSEGEKLNGSKLSENSSTNSKSPMVFDAGNETKEVESSSVPKKTKTVAKLGRSKAATISTKYNTMTGKTSKKVLIKTAIAAKKVKKKVVHGSRNIASENTAADVECDTKTSTVTKIVSLSKRKRRTNTSRLFCKTQPGLVLTSVDAGDQEVVMSVVKTLGRFTVTPKVDETTSHVVCGHARRTINILTSTVKGCWILSLDWVWKSLEAGQWLPEEPYEMADCFPAAQFFRLERAEAGLMFRPSFFKKAGSIFVSPSCSPPSVQLELLLISGGAHVTGSQRKADVCVGCHSPREGGEEGVVCVTEHWILDSISEHQMLPYDSYLLDKSHSRATSPEL